MNAISALKSALSAIANAEAVAGPLSYEVRLGAGVGDVARRELSDQDVTDILRVEIEERATAAAQYEHRGQSERAVKLRAEAAVLLDYVDPDEARG